MTDVTDDRRLLELAAKAAGISISYSELRETFEKWESVETDGCGPTYLGDFDPLDDDGHAFRLMVQLGLHVRVCRRVVLVEMRDLGNDVILSLSDDPCAATRLAIVRAAAQIGMNRE